MEVLLIEFFHFRSEYFLENLVNLNIMSKLDHSVCLIKNQILEILKVEDLILKEFMNTTRCSDNNVRISLSDYSKLSLF